MRRVRNIFLSVAVFTLAPFSVVFGQATLESPLKGISSISELIAALLNVVVQIGAPIAVLMVVYSGFLFVSARGNETKLTAAKQAIVWTLVGTALLLGAWVIAQILDTTIQQIRG